MLDTSKLQQAGKFSRRGLFLASLASLSLLTVTSRHVDHRTTSSVIFHHSTPVARLIPAPAHQDLRVGEHGTCVTVNDLFGNMPVRVKRRALSVQNPDELDKEWDHLRSSLVSLLLANSQLSRLVISDIDRSKRISIRIGNISSANHVDPSAAEVDLERIGSIFAQSGLMNSRNMESWHVVSAKIQDLKIQAAISTVPSPSKRIQFISLGKDPVLSWGNSNILFNEVNRLFSLSDFGNSGDSHRGTPATCPNPLPDDSVASGSVGGRSRAKSVNKWPMFYIRIDTASIQHLADDSEEPSADSEKSINQIMDVLGAMIMEFLKQQNLRPRMMKRQKKMSDRSRPASDVGLIGTESIARGNPVSSTEEALSSHFKLPLLQKPQSANTGQQFYQWSRVKAANISGTLAPSAEAHVQPNSDHNNRLDGNHLSLAERPKRDNIQRVSSHWQSTGMPLRGFGPLPAGGDVSNETEQEKYVRWIDPHTGKVHLIDSRTGQTVKTQSSAAGSRLQPGNSVGAWQKQTNFQGPQSTTASNQDLWVENLLREWENPTFARTELPVPSIDMGSHLEAGKASHAFLQAIGSIDANQVAKFEGKLQKQSLATAKIIAQVDQKFILAKLESTSVQTDEEGVLVLIDQHAADERCRVERLFEEMFIQSETSMLIRQVHMTEMVPITFKVSSTEASLFRKYLDFFKEWGIHYCVESQSEYGENILIQALPTLIAERCRLEPSLVVDLLRREIWTSEEQNIKSSISMTRKKPITGYDASSQQDINEQSSETMAGSSHAPHSWVQKMSGCPQGIFDLLNSRACRGAIMFNDPLSIEECKTLVARLSRCAFPFQCAHGRPSMVPILDLRSRIRDDPLASDADISHVDDEDQRASSFIDAFRASYVH